MYQLDHYNSISKSKYSSEHGLDGGLLIYVHTDFEYELLSGIEQRTTSWEQLFVKIRHKSPNSKIHYRQCLPCTK